MIRSLLTPALLAAGLAVTPAAAGAAVPASNLFTVSSRTATLRPTGDHFRLTLGAGLGAVTRFSDRPQRLAGRESARMFVARWRGRGFADDPPEANVVVDGRPASSDSMVLELRAPRMRAGRLSFDARRVGGDRRLPTRLGPTHLFIDDASTSQPYALTLRLPSAGSVDLAFDSSTVVIGTGLQGAVYSSVGGGGFLTPTAASITNQITGTGSLLGFSVLSAPGTITGTATFADGATAATLQVGSGAPVPISAGAFSVPTG